MAVRMSGLSTPATLLQIPMMLIRRAADSMGPMMEMYGLEAVCNNARPIPWTKRPLRNRPKVRVSAAGMNTSAPSAMISRPSDIPFLKPVFFKISDDGRARKK
jgi:hypothetical protein